MKKIDSNQDNQSTQKELERLRKENKKLQAKYNEVKKNLKKKDVRRITLTDEQHRLLLSLFPDIDSLL